MAKKSNFASRFVKKKAGVAASRAAKRTNLRHVAPPKRGIAGPPDTKCTTCTDGEMKDAMSGGPIAKQRGKLSRR